MLSIEKLLGYEGKNVVITGAASGMAKAATELLLSLGANVWAIDRNPVDLPVRKSIQADLSRQDTIDDLMDELPDKIDAAFICHGVALMKGRDKLVQMINYVGAQYLAEHILPRVVDCGSITFISSTGGYDWSTNLKYVDELISLHTFPEQEAWIDSHLSLFENPDFFDSYCFSKQCLSAYVKKNARDERYIGRKIRLNAIGPSYSATGLIKDFNLAISTDGTEASGAEIMNEVFLKSWNGRPGTSEEMGYPLVLIGSDVFSYLSGQVIYIDYGFTSVIDYENAKKQSEVQ